MVALSSVASFSIVIDTVTDFTSPPLKGKKLPRVKLALAARTNAVGASVAIRFSSPADEESSANFRTLVVGLPAPPVSVNSAPVVESTMRLPSDKSARTFWPATTWLRIPASISASLISSIKSCMVPLATVPSSPLVASALTITSTGTPSARIRVK